MSGYARSGKDTAAELLAPVFTRIAFADALKELALEVNPFVSGKVTVNRLSALVTCCEDGWDEAKSAFPEVREFLQRLGVGVRTVLGEDAWIRAAFDKMPLHDHGASFVITDVRFPNEAQAVKRVGGQVWRITRPGVGPANGHESETALDDYPFDAIVHNDSDLQTFETRLWKQVALAGAHV